MKSYLDLAVSVYGGVLEDARHRWPELSNSFEMDLSYLLRVAEHRGLKFFTITLPACGKVFDKHLDSGLLVSTEYPQGFPMIKKRPKLFGELFNLVFGEDSMLKLDADAESVFFLRQLFYGCKNMELDCDASTTESTLNEYFAIESQLPPSHQFTWDSNIPEWQERTGHPLWGETDTSPDPSLPGLEPDNWPDIPWNKLRDFSRRLIQGLGPVDWWKLRPKHGPGAVSDSRLGLKYELPVWPKKLDLWFPFDWFGSGSLEPKLLPFDFEPPSEMHAVPKSQKGPRLICAEPTAHQWMQQSIWRWLEGRLKHSPLGLSINFRSQEYSRERALDASLYGDMATIDLSSASDRLSTRLVEYIFQGHEILDGMHACRTRMLRQSLTPHLAKYHLLRKFSTQGSALTFPVQSIVFSILSVWAVMLHDRNFDYREKTLRKYFAEATVFGDDIIVPTRAIETVKLVLHECGLKVNQSKTYSGSNFRESCGMDAFRGVDVTPASILMPYDASPSAIASVVESANNFFSKGLWNASKTIESTIPPQESKLLRVCKYTGDSYSREKELYGYVGGADGAFGLCSFVGSDTSHLRRGWDRDLHRNYSISLSVTSKVTKVRGHGYADLLQYFTERPSPLVKWAAGQVKRVSSRKEKTKVYD